MNHDQKILDIIDKASEEITGFGILSRKTIARYMVENEKTFSSGVNDDNRDFIDLNRITKLYNGLKMASNPAHNQLQEVVLKILQKEQIKLLQDMDIEKYIHTFRNNDLAYFKLASSAIIVVSAQSDLAAYLPELFDPNSFIKKLNFIVNKDSIAHDIVLIEQWAYSRDGNYSDQLYLNLYERDHEPISEMVGAFIEGEFRAYIYDEGYKLMSEIGHDLLLDEEQRLSEEHPVWSLPRSPEARFIERLRRELKDYSDLNPNPNLPPELLEEVLDFLADKVVAYDAADPAIKEGHPFNRLHEALASEIRDRYKDEEKYKVDEVTRAINRVETIYLCTLLQDL